MYRLTYRVRDSAGFTFAEVIVAIAVCVIFGMAAIATNQRLLLAIKTQREQTAASMMLQERMEAFRSLMYSGICTNTTSGSTNPPSTAADVVSTSTASEAPLGSMTETITVGGYMDTSGTVHSPTTDKNMWVRNAAYPTGSLTTSYSTLATSYDLIEVDIQIQWTSANGRVRNREMATIIGKGNRGS